MVAAVIAPGAPYLPNAFFRFLHVVFGSSCPVDHPPHLRVHWVPLERVHAFAADLVIDGRVQNCAIRQVCLLSQILQRPGGEHWNISQSEIEKKKHYGLMPEDIIIERLKYYLQQCGCMNTHTFQLNCTSTSEYKPIQQLCCADTHPPLSCRILFIQQFVLVTYI